MMEIVGPLVLGVALIVSVIGGFIYTGKHDTPAEETIEKVIEEVTGVDIDLTPTSPEK